MFNKPVYKFELLSIKPEIRVNNDERMKTNIMNAIEQGNIEPVTTIIVKETCNPSYFREIITNRLIPAYRVITNVFDDNRVSYDIPKSPCFVKYSMKVGFEEEVLETDAVRATPAEVQEYISKHDMTDDYALNLFEIFERGKQFYNDSKAKGIVSDEKQISQMLKFLKRGRRKK